MVHCRNDDCRIKPHADGYYCAKCWEQEEVLSSRWVDEDANPYVAQSGPEMALADKKEKYGGEK